MPYFRFDESLGHIEEYRPSLSSQTNCRANEMSKLPNESQETLLKRGNV